MVFSDTTNKTGLIQEMEWYTGMSNGGISGNILYLQQATNRINRAYDKVLPRILSQGDIGIRFDDTNHTSYPIATVDIVANQWKYAFLSDSDGNSIYNILKIFAASNATVLPGYDIELYRIVPGDTYGSSGVQSGVLNNMITDEYSRTLSPLPSNIGTPTGYIEVQGYFMVNPIPSYTLANGFQVHFERAPSRFVYTDTTKTPGIPDLFHPLLVLHAALDWVKVLKPDNTALANHLVDQIKQTNIDIDTFYDKASPSRHVMSPFIERSE